MLHPGIEIRTEGCAVVMFDFLSDQILSQIEAQIGETETRPR